MLAILDYKSGNQTSVARALQYLNIDSVITEKHSDVRKSKGIIFPGVGAAGQAMQHLKESQITDILYEAVEQEKPVLGICLGCHILLEHCQENDTKGLGIIKGEAIAFDFTKLNQDETKEKLRIPHMGWNKVKLKQPNPMFNNINPNAQFYFVHSFYPKPETKYIIATTEHGLEFCSAYAKDNLWAVQFHPEKSGTPGLKLLQNFYDFC